MNTVADIFWTIIEAGALIIFIAAVLLWADFFSGVVS